MNIFFKISLFFFAFYDKLILVDLGALLSYGALFSYYSQTKPIKYDNLNTTNKKIIYIIFYIYKTEKYFFAMFDITCEFQMNLLFL